MYHSTINYLSTESFPNSSESENFTSPNLTTSFILAQLFAQNWWNVFDERYLRHSFGSTIVISLIFLVVLFIGVIGNCTVIFILVGHPHMRSVTNMFIMNLAVADLLVIVFYVPVKLFENVFTPWILGTFTCKCVSYIQMVSICASAYSLVAISLVRCRAVYRSFGQIRLSKSQTMKMILLIWVIAAVLLSPWLIIFHVKVSETDGLPYCIEKWGKVYHGKIYYVIANLIFCYCVPVAIILTSSMIICWRVTYRPVPEESASTHIIKRMHQKARNHIRRMLGMVTLAFLLSWLPLHVILIRKKFGVETNLHEFLLPLAEILGSGNSCVNPVLYAFLNKEFRESVQSILPSPLRSQRRRESLASMCMVSYGVTASNIIFPNALRYQIDSRLLQGCSKRFSEGYPKQHHSQYYRHRNSYPNLPMNFLQVPSQQTSRTTSPSRSPVKDFGFNKNLVSKNGAASTDDRTRSELDDINEM